MSISYNTLRLLECFKSITFIFPDKGDSADIITFDEVSNWIKSYNKWYTTVIGMEDGKHLHLSYGREVEIVGNQSFLINEQLEKIYNASCECGFLFKLNIALCDLAIDSSTFLDFLSDRNGIAINIHASQNIVEEETLSILETIASKNVLLSLIGPYSFWNKLGILSSQIMNRYLYRIIPISNSYEKHFLLDSFDPCARRFHIVVDENGWIYPCRGLIGITQCCLGTIYDDISKIKILDNKYPISLSSLEMNGPELTEASWKNIENLSSIQQMPLVCSIHRNQLQRA